MENKKSGKKTIGIAMAAIMLASIFATFVPASIGQPAPPAGGVVLYFHESDTSVPEGSGHARIVQMRANISSGQTLMGGQVGINYTETCVDIVDVDWDPNIDTSLSDWNNTMYPECWGPGNDWIRFKFKKP